MTYTDCSFCRELHKREPAGTHTYAENGVRHTHPKCAARAFAGKS